MPIVRSPILKEDYLVGDNQPLVDAYCPIEGTQLVFVREPHISGSYLCVACGASYRFGDKSSQSLNIQAREHARRLEEELEEGQVLLKDVMRQKRIIDVARKTLPLN